MDQSTSRFTSTITPLRAEFRGRRNLGLVSLAILVCMLALLPILAAAQSQLESQRGAVCQGDSGGGCPGRNTNGNNGREDRLTAADIEAQKKYAQWLAYKANQKGVEEFNKGNYAKALKQFHKATEYGSNAGYEQYITEAQEHLGIQHFQEAQRKLAPIDASVSNHIAESQHKTQANVSELQQKTQTLVSKTITAQQGTNSFGSIGPGEKPTLTTVTLPNEHANSALEQASAMAKSGQAAAKMADDHGDPDIYRAISSCGFNDNPCAQPDHLDYARPVQSAAATELSNRIPDAAKNNPVILLHLHDLDRAALHRQGIEQKIADVEQKINAKDPNAEILAVYKADLVNQAAKDKQDEQQAQAAIKGTLDDLGLNWVEEPPKPPAKPKPGETKKD
jgi:hypothetical protein